MTKKFFALTFLLVFFGAAFAENDWHEKIPLTITRDQVTLMVPLTKSWEVSSIGDGLLSASNDSIGTKLDVQILQATGELDTFVRNLFPPRSCSSLQSRHFTEGSTDIEEVSCEAGSPFPSVKLGRFFFENGDLVSIESQTSPDKFPLFADSIWSILRDIRPQTGLASLRVPEGEKLYQNPDKSYQLTYPSTWQQEMTGKTLVLYLPKGPSIQVIPATDQVLKNDPKLVFLSFQQSLSYSLKGFNVESRDTMNVKGKTVPRLTYDYALPDGSPEKAWALFLDFPKSAYIFVCASPSSSFVQVAPDFSSVIESFQVLQ